MSLDPAVRQQILLEAAKSDDPEATVVELTAAVATPDRRLLELVDKVAGAKNFVTTVKAVTKEESSNRGLVTFQSTPNEKNPTGEETARTPRLESNLGSSVARKVRALVGHKVFVTVALSPMGEGRTFRELLRVSDLGPVASE